MIDIVGGPGGTPFPSKPWETEESVKEFRRVAPEMATGVTMKEHPNYQLLKRGFSIVSIGYWGTDVRTLNVPGEFELAMAEIENVIDFYRGELGRDPPLITTSLGNHLALGAFGKDRLGKMQALALVPVMDGLQHHLVRYERENGEDQNKRRTEGKPFGHWQNMNVYSNSSEEAVFDHSRMMPMHEYIPRFIGEADYPWHYVTPQGPCSRIVLGSKDPRTRDYLASNDNLPDHVTVLDSDHDIIQDALDQTRNIFAEYAECLVGNDK